MPIRQRSAADMPACVAALRIVQEVSGYPTRWPADPAGWLSPADLVGAWVADLDGAVVGHVCALAGTAIPGLASAVALPADGLVLVSRLYVTPAARGHGIAKALVAAVVEYGSAHGLRAGLDVMADSVDAIALYESLGWQRRATEQAHWTTQRGDHPLVHYYLAP